MENIHATSLKTPPTPDYHRVHCIALTLTLSKAEDVVPFVEDRMDGDGWNF